MTNEAPANYMYISSMQYLPSFYSITDDYLDKSYKRGFKFLYEYKDSCYYIYIRKYFICDLYFEVYIEHTKKSLLMNWKLGHFGLLINFLLFKWLVFFNICTFNSETVPCMHQVEVLYSKRQICIYIKRIDNRLSFAKLIQITRYPGR